MEQSLQVKNLAFLMYFAPCQSMISAANPPTIYRSLSGPLGQRCPSGCPRSWGVSHKVSLGFFGALTKIAQHCHREPQVPQRIHVCAPVLGAPNLGSAEGGHPDLFRFSLFSSDLRSFFFFGNAPICSYLLGLPPICSDLFSELFSGIPRSVPICSVFFEFVPICFRTNQDKSGKPPFLPTPFLRIT